MITRQPFIITYIVYYINVEITPIVTLFFPPCYLCQPKNQIYIGDFVHWIIENKMYYILKNRK